MKDYKIAVNKRVLECLFFLQKREKQSEICRKLAVKPAKFSEIMNERMAAGLDIIQNLCIQYDVSPDWLLLGRGEMLRATAEKPAANPPLTAENQPDSGIIIELTRQISELSRENGRLQAENTELKKELARSEAAAAASARTA